jgi:hypothetical protein
VAIVVLGTEVDGGGILIVGEGDFVEALMRP